MIYALILLAQLGGLFLLSQQLERSLWLFFSGIARSPKVTMWMMALLFLPGTFVHEVAHLVVAKLLLVPAGSLTLLPHLVEGRVIMGSVMIAQTDRVRRLIIGIAPGILGLAIIFTCLWLAQKYGLWDDWVWRIVLAYVVFQIGNCLFSSKEDLQGALGLMLFIAIIVGLLYWWGLRVDVSWVGSWLDQYRMLIEQAVTLFWIPLAIDAAAISVIWIISKALPRR